MACILPMIASSKKCDDAGWRRDKARYIFMEALRQREAENDGAFYDLVGHAYNTDSTYTAAAYYYGLSSLMRRNVSQEDAERGIALMRKHFEAHPEDYYEAYTYANVLPQIGDKE